MSEKIQSEAERAEAANRELARLATEKTEEELIEWRKQWHVKRRHVHVTDNAGKTHEHHVHPHGITHMVRVQGPKAGTQWFQCGSAEIAMKVAKNATLSKEQHISIADRHRDPILHISDDPHAAKRIVEAHEKLASEAEGKTAEIMVVRDAT